MGIASSTCINSLVNTIILLWILKARQLTMQWMPFTMVLLKSLCAATVMGVAVWVLYNLCMAYAPRWIVVPVVIGLGGMLYFGLIAALAPATVKSILSDFISRRRRKKK